MTDLEEFRAAAAKSRLEKHSYAPILQWLNSQPLTVAERVRNEMYRGKDGKPRREAGHRAGVPDIVGWKMVERIIGGRKFHVCVAFAFEVKRDATKKLSPDQERWGRRFHERVSGFYFRVDSLDDAIAAFAEI